jgi:hypothetical protein
MSSGPHKVLKSIPVLVNVMLEISFLKTMQCVLLNYVRDGYGRFLVNLIRGVVFAKPFRD